MLRRRVTLCCWRCCTRGVKSQQTGLQKEDRKLSLKTRGQLLCIVPGGGTRQSSIIQQPLQRIIW